MIIIQSTFKYYIYNWNVAKQETRETWPDNPWTQRYSWKGHQLRRITSRKMEQNHLALQKLAKTITYQHQWCMQQICANLCLPLWKKYRFQGSKGKK